MLITGITACAGPILCAKDFIITILYANSTNISNRCVGTRMIAPDNIMLIIIWIICNISP